MMAAGTQVRATEIEATQEQCKQYWSTYKEHWKISAKEKYCQKCF